MSRLLASRLRVRQLLIGTLGIGLFLLTGPARQASAHAELVSTDPAAGAVLDASPAAITVTFSEPVEIGVGALRLFDGTGEPIPIGEAAHTGGDTVVSVALPVLQRGSYVVSWQALSSDSHPVAGAFIFQIGSASTLGPDVLADVVASNRTNATAGLLLGLTRGIVIAGMAVVGGGLMAISLGVVTLDSRHRRIMIVAALAAGVAGALALPLESAYATGSDLGAVVDPAAWRSILQTRSGVAWLVRATAMYFGGVALVISAARHREGWWRSSVVALLVTFGVASAYGGHGGSGRWLLVGIWATVVHVVAMAVWVGGLVALAVALPSATAVGVRRFSRIALVLAVAVVGTGLLQATRQLTRTDALFDTDYGRFLLAKVFAVTLVIGFAGASRTAVSGRGASGHRILNDEPAGLGAGVPEPAATTTVVEAEVEVAVAIDRDVDVDRATLRRSLFAELLFVAAVIVLTASLTGSNPAAAGATEPFGTTVVTDDYLATIAIDPAQIGPNQVHLYLSSPGGSLSTPDSVTVTIAEPAKQVAPIEVAVFPAGANHYQALGASFPFAGTWVLTIRAVYDTFTEIVFTTEVPIG